MIVVIKYSSHYTLCQKIFQQSIIFDKRDSDTKVYKKPMNSINMIRIRYRIKTIELKLWIKTEQCNGIDFTDMAKRHKYSPNIKPEYTKRVNILKIQLHPKNKQKNKSLSNLKHHVNKVTWNSNWRKYITFENGNNVKLRIDFILIHNSERRCQCH